MQSQEQELIDQLFDRLKTAEAQDGARDSGAEAHIRERLRAQPNAAYYMAQTVLIQEAALKKLQARVTELEQSLAQATANPPRQESGSFLSGLFGGGSRPAATPPQAQAPAPSYGSAPSTGRGSSFLSGALQTAAGVAGGVMVADMLTGMFHHSQPEEIVNIIQQPAVPGGDGGDSGSFFSGDSDQWPPSDSSGYDNSFDNGSLDGSDNWGDDEGFV